MTLPGLQGEYAALVDDRPHVCATLAIALRRRQTAPGWSYRDDRLLHCRRLIRVGETFVQLFSPHPTPRFCTACAGRVLGLAGLPTPEPPDDEGVPLPRTSAD